MITFLVCLALLVTAYFTYGRYLERLVGIDPAARTPCSRLYDGVDYVPLPRWRIFLIQLLNIAGLGPIFGAVLGAAYGPVAFLWITFGGIFMGAAHDFIAGVISLRHDGASLPETAGVYLGGGMKIVMRLFSAGLMILVGAVFLSQPASLVAARLDVPSLEGIAFGGFSWLLLIVLGVILVYYIAATLLPVDKIIGRIYRSSASRCCSWPSASSSCCFSAANTPFRNSPPSKTASPMRRPSRSSRCSSRPLPAAPSRASTPRSRR